MRMIPMRGATKLAAAALLSTLLLAGALSAGPILPPSTTTYYDDAGEVVGVRLVSCSGATGLYGERTDTYTIEYLSCRD